MDEEGKEGKKANNLYDKRIRNDVRRRREKSSGNVEDSRRTVQAEDPSHSASTATSIQYDKNDGRQRQHGETSPESRTAEASNRRARRENH